MSPQPGPSRTPANAPRRAAKPPRTFDRAGSPATGRIVRILIGQGYGFIRQASGGEVYFHRADMPDRSKLSDLRIGDRVVFELVDDPVSGPRALGVRRPE